MYFVTVCTHARECIFGSIIKEKMILNDEGKIVEEVWKNLSVHSPRIEADCYVVMPNHFYGVIAIANETTRSQSGQAGNRTSGAINRAPTLGEIMRAFKARCTVRINRSRGGQVLPVWQRNFYDHVIRNEKDLNRIREYILMNPSRWEWDEENILRKEKINQSN
jgi:REP element-mobilizing transposase RayT